MDVGSVDNFIAEQAENKRQSHITKHTTRCKTFANPFRKELRKVEEIPAGELNEYICEFIISVRTKDYEPCLLEVYWQVLNDI